MKLKTILESKGSLQELIGQAMPINAAFKISKIQKELNSILELFDDRKRNLFNKYGKDNQITKENEEVYIKEYTILLEEELDLEIEKVSIDKLGDISIAPAHLTNLDWLLE